jgi:hypothetical protein
MIFAMLPTVYELIRPEHEESVPHRVHIHKLFAFSSI